MTASVSSAPKSLNILHELTVRIANFPLVIGAGRLGCRAVPGMLHIVDKPHANHLLCPAKGSAVVSRVAKIDKAPKGYA
ncbi:MAG TPA: hypothetical protein VGI91_01515 [Steroidobacteraceae bacterium]